MAFKKRSRLSDKPRPYVSNTSTSVSSREPPKDPKPTEPTKPPSGIEQEERVLAQRRTQR